MFVGSSFLRAYVYVLIAIMCAIVTYPLYLITSVFIQLLMSLNQEQLMMIMATSVVIISTIKIRTLIKHSSVPSFANSANVATGGNVFIPKNDEIRVRSLNLIPNIGLSMKADHRLSICLKLIDEACAKISDDLVYVFCFPEISLGYDAGDTHSLNNDVINRKTIEGLKEKSKNFPKYIIGFGMTCSTQVTERDNDPRKVITYIYIQNGEIVNAYAKKVLAVGGVEYEPLWFKPWNNKMIVCLHDDVVLTISDDTTPIVADDNVHIYTSICAEAWEGFDPSNRDHNLSIQRNKILVGLLRDSKYTKKADFDTMKSFLCIVEDSLTVEAIPVFPYVNETFFTHNEIDNLNASANKLFGNYLIEYKRMKSEFDTQMSESMTSKSRILKQVTSSDAKHKIFVIPNGSHSSTGKLNIRYRLLKQIGDSLLTHMSADQTVEIVYGNSAGVQGGSVAYDGANMRAYINKNMNEVCVLLITDDNNIAVLNDEYFQNNKNNMKTKLNGQPVYVGKKATQLGYGHEMTDTIEKLIADRKYAYSSLCMLLSKYPTLQNEFLPKKTGLYSGYMVSMSGGFDSAGVATTIADSIQMRFRELIKKENDIDFALDEIKKELLLGNRPVNETEFVQRFISVPKNTQALMNVFGIWNNWFVNAIIFVMYIIMHIIIKMTGEVVSTGSFTTFLNQHYVIQVKKAIFAYDIKTVSDLLDVINKQITPSKMSNETVSLVSRVITFHVVSGIYIRTDNNSADTERAAEKLAHSLGINFEAVSVQPLFLATLLEQRQIKLNLYNEQDRMKLLNIQNEVLTIPKKSSIEKNISDAKKILETSESESESESNHVEIKKQITMWEKLIGITDDQLSFQECLYVSYKEKSYVSIQDSYPAKLKQLEKEAYDIVIKTQPVFVNDSQTLFLHNWFESRSGLEIENVQARLRAAENWTVATKLGYMPTSNPNNNESTRGYTTTAGDLHAGSISFTLHRSKKESYATLIFRMKYDFTNSSFWGEIDKCEEIRFTFDQPPSAELQQLVAGLIAQTDEDSHGVGYPMMQEFLKYYDRIKNTDGSYKHWWEVYNEFFRDNEPTLMNWHPLHIWSVMDDTEMFWYGALFKRMSAPFAMTNPDVSSDPHTAHNKERAGTANVMRFNRAALILIVLYDMNIITVDGKSDKDDQTRNMLIDHLRLNFVLQERLKTFIWGTNSLKDFVKINLSKSHFDKLLMARAINSNIDLNVTTQQLTSPNNPIISQISEHVYTSNKIHLKPIHTKARDIAGNLWSAKLAIIEAHKQGGVICVIPDIFGHQLGDNVAFFQQKHIQQVQEDLRLFSTNFSNDFTFIVGHISNHNSKYYHSASVFNAGKYDTFYENCVVNQNYFKPFCADYSPRTMSEWTEEQKPILINGVSSFVMIGNSVIPDGIAPATNIIYVGTGHHFIECVERIPSNNFVGAVNVIGSSSCIDTFAGECVNYASDISQIREASNNPINHILNDAMWTDAYLPAALTPNNKVTLVMDGVGVLKTIATLMKMLEIQNKRNNTNYTVDQVIDVVAVPLKEEIQFVQNLYAAIKELFNIDVKQENSGSKHPSQIYEINSLVEEFKICEILADIDIRSFISINENDTFVIFMNHLRKFLSQKNSARKEDLLLFRNLLLTSDAYTSSLQKTYHRKLLVGSDITFNQYCEFQINDVIRRIEHFDLNTDEYVVRTKTCNAWFLSARDGGEGQIMFSNIELNELLAGRNTMGNRLNQGGLSVTSGFTLDVMYDSIVALAKELRNITHFPATHQLFIDRKNEVVAESGNIKLTRGDVDAIHKCVRYNTEMYVRFNFAAIKVSPPSTQKGTINNLDPHTIDKNILNLYVQHYTIKNLERHAMCNAPLTKWSVDLVYNFREPMCSSWLYDLIE